jgi:hypothetical protein
MYSDATAIERSLSALADELADRELHYELVVLGGGSLLARSLTSRSTGDIDVLGIRLPDGSIRSAFEFPPDLQAASDQVASAYGLPARWLDDRPGSDFANAAPDGYESRLEVADYGASLRVWHLARFDIAAIKLIAAAERWGEPQDKHWFDVRALMPTADEIDHAREFANRVWAPTSASWSHLEEIIGALDDVN